MYNIGIVVVSEKNWNIYGLNYVTDVWDFLQNNGGVGQDINKNETGHELKTVETG